jgi:hypothetical protein
MVPTLGKDDRRYSGDWAAAQEEERAAARRQEREAQQRREAAALAANPGQVRWWEGEVIGPGKAI